MKYAASAAFAVAAVIWHIVIFRISPSIGLVNLNFRKKPVMSSYGIVSFVYFTAIISILVTLGYADREQAELFVTVMGAMWTLGVIDDILGTREVGGFKGHFKKLLYERKLTTGAIKAIGGGIVGVLAGWHISGGDAAKWIPAALVIPLAANVLNLVDLRPGRAVAVFFFGLGVTCVAEFGALNGQWVIGTAAAVALAWWVPDSRGRAMMGDSWANALGAALGLTIVLNTNPAFQTAVIAALIAIHWYSEKRSISALIERNAILRRIDTLLGVR